MTSDRPRCKAITLTGRRCTRRRLVYFGEFGGTPCRCQQHERAYRGLVRRLSGRVL